MSAEGILLIDKPRGITSFSVVAQVRKKIGVQTVGHAGTLDPFATGVLVILVGRKFTRMQDKFLTSDKEYVATLLLGSATDTYDLDGKQVKQSEYIPKVEEIAEALKAFQGEIEQIPPMYSAKKIAGKRLYELARQGKEIERKSCKVTVITTIVSYEYPHLKLHVTCSKGTYIRSLAHDLGVALGCYAHVIELARLRVGPFKITACSSLDTLDKSALIQADI